MSNNNYISLGGYRMNGPASCFLTMIYNKY